MNFFAALLVREYTEILTKYQKKKFSGPEVSTKIDEEMF